MTNINAVVTIDRYNSGLNYTEYLSKINVNKERFEEFYQNFDLPNEIKEIASNKVVFPDPFDPYKTLIPFLRLIFFF